MHHLRDWKLDLSMFASIFAEASERKLEFGLDELQRRMEIVGMAGVTDPDDFKRYVLSEDAA